MSKLQPKNLNDKIHCYNCGTEINNIKLKQCPNCGTILDPNHYIKWRNSFIGCLCLFCLIPILIVILVGLFSI
jgi:hypothetical protein